MRGRRRTPPADDGAAPGAQVREQGLRIPAERLTIGVRLSDDEVVLHLDGELDRGGRPALLRVAHRVARSSDGVVVVDCAGLTSADGCGIDALASLRRLPGIRSVRLRHVDPDLGRRLEAAGLGACLGVRPPTPTTPAGR